MFSRAASVHKETLPSEYVVLASLKPAPRRARVRLEPVGIRVIDNVCPGGSRESELKDYVSRY